MELRFTDEEIAFRNEVRTFFESSLPEDIRKKQMLGQRLSRENMVTWQRILNRKGWVAPMWPVEYGGTGWDPVRYFIFREELHAGYAPDPLSFNINMIGPVLCAFAFDTVEEVLARANATPIDWSAYQPTVPRFIGRRVFKNFDLTELEGFIDWGPFFQTWDLAGPFPAILKDEVVGSEAQRVFSDGKRMLRRLIEGRWLTAHAVVGLYPANSVGDDIEIYADETRSKVLGVNHELRQQVLKEKDGEYLCLADFVAPKESRIADYLGAFAVTSGAGLDAIVAEFEKSHDDYGSIMAKALADRLAEAFAERLHQQIRKEFWGYNPTENLPNEELIREKYLGIRPAPGYPACPDHTEKGLLFKLLGVEDKTVLRLTESYAMWPAAAVSGWYFAHPQSRYFGVGKIGRDQVEDYARRKGWTVAETEKWLSPNLGYSTN